MLARVSSGLQKAHRTAGAARRGRLWGSGGFGGFLLGVQTLNPKTWTLGLGFGI